MAEERTLGLAHAYERGNEELSKEALQLHMEEARESISQTVTEIKDSVTHQYEQVKEALDWREHVKKKPVAWSLGAAGVGFFVGYGIAGAIKDSRHHDGYVANLERPYAAEHLGEPAKSHISPHTNGRDKGPGLVTRITETRAFDRLQEEVGKLGDRLVDDLSTTAQEVVLPALLRKIKEWIGADLTSREQPQEGASARPQGSPYKPDKQLTVNN